MWDNLKSKIPIKPFMAVYLGLLFLYFCLAQGQIKIFFTGLLIILVHTAADLIWTYAREHAWHLPLSSIISGLILSLVALPINNILLALLLPLLAVVGKKLINLGKPRHIFNPAALSMALVSLFVPIISWWGVAWSSQLLWIIIPVGTFILWKQNRWQEWLSFLGIYTVGLFLFFTSVAYKIAAIPPLIFLQFFNGPLLFFTTVMLIEPITSTFPTKKQRIFYGASAGFFVILLALLKLPVDPLIYGLLLGNLITSLLFL